VKTSLLFTFALLCTEVGLPPNQKAFAQTTSLDVVIALAKHKLEQDQRRAYEMLSLKPKTYSKEELAKSQREADQKILAGFSKFPQVRAADIETLKAKLIQARQALSKIPEPTQYDDIGTYETIQITLTQITDRVQAYQKGHPTKPKVLPPLRQLVVGTVPTRDINAQMQRINPGEEDKSRRVYLIEVDAGLLQFAQVFSNILAKIVMPVEPRGHFFGFSLKRDDVEQYVQGHPLIQHEFNELIRTYLVRGVPYVTSEFRPEELEEPYATLSSLLYRSMVVYTLAHELGHVIDDQAGSQLPMDLEIPEAWRHEYSADYWAVVLSLMVMGHNTTMEAAVLGARQFFACYDLIERGISTVTTGQESYRAIGNHPPANKRKERITAYVLASLRNYWNLEPSSLDDVHQLINSSESLESATDVLWLGVRPSLLDLHYDKAQLAPGWKSPNPVETP
jgi:hypothetical protein